MSLNSNRGQQNMWDFHVNPMLSGPAMRRGKCYRVTHAHFSSPENGSRNIAGLILVGLAALAGFSFAWQVSVSTRSEQVPPDRLLSSLHR